MSNIKCIEADDVSTAIAGVNFKCLFTGSIRNSDETFTIIEPLCETIPCAITLTVLKDCALPIRHCKRFAAYCNG